MHQANVGFLSPSLAATTGLTLIFMTQEVHAVFTPQSYNETIKTLNRNFLFLYRKIEKVFNHIPRKKS
jgi:hypothetical protein